MLEIEKPIIECIESNEDGTYGKYVVEPLERGYGITLGNAMRRILLSSLLLKSIQYFMNFQLYKALKKMLQN